MSIKHFRNVRVYRLTGTGSDDLASDLGHLLAEHGSHPIGKHVRETSGFVPALPPGDAFAVNVSKTGTLISLLIQEKILPASVINDKVAAKVQEIEKREDRTVGARERRTIRDEIEFDLLPQAFVKKTHVNALVSPPYIFVDTSNALKAELLLKRLREAVGSLPLIPLSTKSLPVEAMTRWVLHGQDETPAGLFVGEKFKSRASFGDTQTLSGNGFDLRHDQTLHGLLSSGSHEVIEMELASRSTPCEAATIPFTLTEKLVLKGIQWPGELRIQAGSDAGEDADAITSQLAVMLLVEAELREITSNIAASFGGEIIPEEQEGR